MQVAKRWYVAVFLLSAAFLLSGCVKFNTRIEIRPDGSGQWAIGFGISQELRSLANLGREEFNLEKYLKDQGIQGMKVHEWREGGYAWQAVTWPFQNIEELNSTAAVLGLFESFELKRYPRVLNDRFELRAVLKSLDKIMASSEQNNSSLLKYNPWLDAQIQIIMPGRVIETNGAFVENQSNIVSWKLLTEQDVAIEVISESSNLTKAIPLVLLVGFLAGGVAAYRVIRKRNAISANV
jgi:hypothetical protein